MPQYTKTMTFGATIERVYQVLTDFERYPEFLPELMWAKILDKDEKKSWWVVEHKLRTFGDLTYTLLYKGEPHYRLTWNLVGGLFKENGGEWELVRRGFCLTDATYRIDFHMTGFVPGIIQETLVKAGFPSILRAFRSRTEEHSGFPALDSLRATGSIKTSDALNIWYEYYPEGRGAILVFCNGLMQDTSAWVRIVKYFQGRRPMLLWDYRGCGGSDTPKRLDTLTMENYCSDLLTVLDHLDIQKAVFLGHSMGVLTILEFYRRFPERVAGLIPVCGSFENPFSTLWGTRNLLPFVNILLKIMEYCPGLVDTFWHLWMATPAGRESILWLGTNRFMVRSDDLEGFIANFSKMSALSFSKAAQNLANQNARDILSQISVPALVVAGENDFWTPLFISEEMADFIPDASLCIVPRGSHTAILDIPELIGLRIEKFLSEKTDSD